MSSIPDLATLAALIADPSRAAMLSALLGGISLPAGELARQAKISPQTASAHLTKLVEGGLLSVTTTGRHRYFRLRDNQVAQVLESMALIAPSQHVHSLNDSLERKALHRARTCYNHLAGVRGVTVTQALVAKGWVRQHDEAFEVTEFGTGQFTALGIDCSQLLTKRRVLARACLDWSERQPHIGGTLGAAMAQRYLELKWIVHVEGSRAVKVTDLGRYHLKCELGIEWI